MTLTTIHCTTCRSTVPWGPHCPECGAYLEFAGEPPWRPEPVEPVHQGVPPVPEPEGSIVEEPAAVIVEEIAAAVPVSADSRAAQHSYVGPIAVLLVGAIITPVVWWAAGSVIGTATGLVFLVWAVVLWPTTRRLNVSSPTTIEEFVVATSVVNQAATFESEREEAPEVQARAPQALPRRTIQSTRALVLAEPEGSVPCVTCTRLNPEDRHYCIWCGALIPDNPVAPATSSLAPTPETAPDARRQQQRRRLSRSWRTPILVLSLLGVLIGSIVFALFGPGAFQVRFGLTSVYQLVNQFIDPYAGNQADVVEVTATSTTRGASPRDVLGPDASTFWVSTPSREQGAGESLTFTFDDAYTINRMVILPGIQNGVFDIRGVSTPQDITLTFDDGSTAQARLSLVQNQVDLQQLVRFPKVTTQTVTLTIDSVYPPRTPSTEFLSEVAISGVRFLTPPEPPQVIRLPTDIQPRTSLPGTT